MVASSPALGTPFGTRFSIYRMEGLLIRTRGGPVIDVTVVCSDLSHNCLGRAHLLTKLLERNYSVEVIGPRDERVGVGPR